jgi:hypothetical protein
VEGRGRRERRARLARRMKLIWIGLKKMRGREWERTRAEERKGREWEGEFEKSARRSEERLRRLQGADCLGLHSRVRLRALRVSLAQL